MDIRSWPWKKKTSEKTTATKYSGSAALSGSNQDDSKTVNNVQISKETYGHLMELEDQVKVLNGEMRVLNDKLSTSQADLLTKDNLVKQHAKVAEEAVSGWEKAESEALALKNQLESVTLLKLTAEERASHLDDALKECMKQIRSVKEEGEQKLQDVVFAKTKQWEKVKYELDSKIDELEQELLRATAENAAISRSLQERSNMLMNVNDEKSRAEAEIEILKANIHSFEREISSLKYEVQVVSKELEIRNEEKNMSVRSAEVANKHHLDDVKKIAKLEAECQRLRGLVRKKLPGPAALAQMKQEVESLGRDYGDHRLRRSAGKVASPRLGPTDFALENVQQFRRENEFLTSRQMEMEEEIKMLREALTKRNNDLLVSRNIYTKMSGKLRSLEAYTLALDEQRSPLKPNFGIPVEGLLDQNGSKPPSLTSMSEDGIDEDGSCSDSWATALRSELSHFKREKYVNKPKKVDNTSSLDLMDDFLEMEKLACLSSESNGVLNNEDGKPEKIEQGPVSRTVSEDGEKETLCVEQHPDVDEAKCLISSNEVLNGVVESKGNNILSVLKSKVALAIDAQTGSFDIGKLLNDINQILDDTSNVPPQLSTSCNTEEPTELLDKHCPEDMGETIENGLSLACRDNRCLDIKASIDQSLKGAISQIHDFVTSMCREITADSNLIHQKFLQFSDSVSKVLCDKIGFENFILALSSILCEMKEAKLRVLGEHVNDGESTTSDCIDKVTLLENKVESGTDRFSAGCAHVPNSESYPDIQHGDCSPGLEVKGTITRSSLQELVQIKLEKDGLQAELAICTESLEQANIQLLEMERQLTELKAQLVESQKSNSLADTQLKCMVESYKTLETRCQELESEISVLITKVDTLNNEFQLERHNHQNVLARCKDLEEQLERYQNSSTCTHTSDIDTDVKVKQEREIAAAAEKLAECQETILVLGRQLKAMRTPLEVDSSNNRFQSIDDFLNGALGRDGSNTRGRHSFQLSDHADLENVSSFLQRTRCESPLDGFNPLFSPPHAEPEPILRSLVSSKHSKHRSSRTSSSHSLSNPVPEKHGRGFSRFFLKGKSDH